MKYDYLVVGAGLYGAVFAHEMREKGKKVLVIDRRPHVAGNAYTEEIEGIAVHRYGAHIFHTKNERVWRYVNRFASFNSYINSPVANYKGRLYNLPFNMNTFYQIWGVKTPAEAKERIRKQREEAGIGEPENLEEQALCLVGRDIYEILVKGYTEKQWGAPCTALDPSIIRRLPVRFTFDNNYFSDPHQGIPEEGYTEMVNRMLEGCEVRLGVDFFKEKEALSRLADKVLYTGQLDEYFDFCFGPLPYRTVKFDTKVLDEENHQGVAVMNYTDRETPYTRVIEHKHFAFGAQEKTVLSYEYSVKWEKGMEPYYPVRNEESLKRYEQYAALAGKEGLLFGGRLAEFKYYDMDQVILSALEKAEKE